MGDFADHVSREDLNRSLEIFCGRNDVKLASYKVDRASASVEGFTSLSLRVKVSYVIPGEREHRTKVFFVKSMPTNDYQRDFIQKTQVFCKEWLYFDKAVPLLKKVSAGKVDVPLPNCYISNYDSSSSYFYMDDLVDKGFRAANRSYLIKGLDYPHCSTVMKRLGTLHALTVAAERRLLGGRRWGEAFTDFHQENLFYVPKPGEPPVPIQGMCDSTCLTIIELSKEIDGFPKEAAASGALEKVVQGLWNTLVRLRRTPANGRYVLIHGDCWMNNMMFKYEKNNSGSDEPVDVNFFDLQLSRCSNPTIDILYFMYLSTRRKFREENFEKLMKEYYTSFTNTLNEISDEPPPFSLEELRSDLFGEYKPFGVIMGVFFAPFMLMGDDFLLPNVDDMDTEQFKDLFETGKSNEIKKHFDMDPVYRATMEDSVREFVDMALPNGLDSVESSPLLIPLPPEEW